MFTNLERQISKLFPMLEIILPNETLTELANISPTEVYLFHFSLGLFVRNNLLTPGSKLYDEFVNADIHHKDDMSSMILSLFSEHLKENKPHR